MSSGDGGLNPAVMQQLATLINTQIDQKLEVRDQQMMKMQENMTAMMGEMKKLTASNEAIMKGGRPGARPRRVSPPRRPARKSPTRKVQKQKLLKSASDITLPTVADAQPATSQGSNAPAPSTDGWVSPANKRLAKVKEKYATLWSSLPRVAELKVDRSKGAVANRAQDLIDERNERQRLSLKYDECRSTVFAPSEWDPEGPDALRLKTSPESELVLEHCHGYHNTGPYTNCTNNNAFVLKSGEVVYYSSAVGIVMNTQTNTQRFYMGHDDDITALAIHPDRTVVASGLVGRTCNILLGDTGAGPRFSEAVVLPGEMVPHEDLSGYPKPATEALGQLKLHTHGITSLDFSPDGKLLCSIGQDPYHLVGIWDWNDGVLLTQARGHNAPVFAMKWNPFQYLGIPDERSGTPVPRPGQAQTLDEAQYCLVSCGQKHIKFWTLRRDVDPKLHDPAAEGGFGEDSKTKGGKTKKSTYKPKHSLPKIWRLEGGSPGASRMAEYAQDCTCLAFVNDTEPIRRFKEGKLVMPDGREGDPTKHWGGMRGRVVVGTAGGDLYVFWQPRAIPKQYDGLSKDEYDENVLIRQSLRAPWWEQPEGTPPGAVAEYRWMSSARLVHVIPRDVEYGNSHLIPKNAWEKLQDVRRQLKARPRDSKLTAMKDELNYRGQVAHKGGVTQVAWQGDGQSSRLMSCGLDEHVRVWDLTLEKAPKTYGVLGHDGKPTDGKHGIVPCKEADLATKRPLINVSQPDEGSVDPLGKAVITSIDWDDARVLMGSRSNDLLDFYSATMEFEVLVRAHTDAINGMSVHRELNLYATVSADKTVRVWRSDSDAATEELRQGHGTSKAKNCFRRCVAVGNLPCPGFCVAWHPTKPELVVGLSNASYVVFRISRGNSEDGSLDTDVDGAMSNDMKRWLQYGEPNVRVMDKIIECDISVFSSTAKSPTKASRDKNKRQRKKKTKFQEQYQQQQAQAKKGGQKLFKSKEEIQDIRYSPNGRWLACASRDNYIHIFDAFNNYRRQGTCKGHSSYCTHIDWSADSRFMQSNDGAYEILYWWDFDGSEPRTDKGRNKCRQYTYAMEMRDAEWDTWTTVLGWPVQGIWSPYSDGTDVNALYRANSQKYCVCGDDSFQVNLFTWPALKGAYARSKQYKGHCSHVLGIQFTGTDSHVISVGGNDATILEWRHRNTDDQKNIRFIRPAGFHGSLQVSGAVGAPKISMGGVSSNVSSEWTTPAATKRVELA